MPLDDTAYLQHNVEEIVLGEFEYFVLSSAARLGDDAYGAAILQDIEVLANRRCSIGALYTTLNRLESKGLIQTSIGDPTPERGGRAKKMVRITARGLCEAQAFYEAVTKASRGMPRSLKAGRS